MKFKKKIVSLLTAVSLCTALVGSAVSVSAAPKYGEEWAGLTNNTAPAATTAPAGNVTPSQGSDVVPSVTAPVSDGTFSDVPSTHWAYNAVERCYKANWFSGYPDGTFHPNDKITRAEACKVFVTFRSEPVSTVTSSTYYDVSPTAWYAPFVEAGKSLFPNRSSLDGQLKFQPEMPVTREDTIYALVKSLGYEHYTENADLSILNMFSDQNSITASVKPYVAVAIQYGLASGYPDGTIGAQDPLTRAEFASLLYRGTFIGVDDTTSGPKVTKDIVIDPSTYKEIMVGESFEITATVNYTDGTSEDYTNKLNPYTDSIEGVITINKNKVTGVGAGTVLINYNAEDEAARSQTLVVEVKSAEEPTPEPTPTPIPEPDPEIAGSVTAKVDKEDIPVSNKRYTVLVMDVSGSMYGEKIDAAKNAASSLCSTVLSAGGDDRIALVQFETDYNTKVVTDFTDDTSTLNSAINNMYAGGVTDIYDGIRCAEELLDNVTDADVTAKSIIVMTDGYPCDGPISSSGKYSASDDPDYYQYANPIYDISQECIGKGYDMYTIGFYISPYEQTSFTATMLKDIQNQGFYLATDTSKLIEVFKNIGSHIIVSGVTVELRDGDTVIDTCETNKGAVSFTFTANPGDYTLTVSAPGYQSYDEKITIESGKTLDLGDIVLDAE